MMTSPPAIAVYGSAARGDDDSFSDRDVLVVAKAIREARDTIGVLKSRGWHPTFYTWPRLRKAAEAGDLFACHLQRESVITRDPDNRLAHLLNDFHPLCSYQARFRKAAEVLLALENVPNSPASLLWALDVAAVAYRSLAISTLADRGIYSFSGNCLRAGLLRLGLLKPTEPDPYTCLRRSKWLYRRGSLAPELSGRRVIWILATIDRVFGLGAHFRVVTPDRFVAEALGRRTADLGWYARSRRLEGALRLLASTDKGEDQLLKRIQQKLVPPSDYGTSIARSCGQWEALVKCLARSGSVQVQTLEGRPAA